MSHHPWKGDSVNRLTKQVKWIHDFLTDQIQQLTVEEEQVTTKIASYWDDYDLDDLCGIVYDLTKRQLYSLKDREYSKVIINYEYDRLTYFNLIKEWCNLKTELLQIKKQKKRFERLLVLKKKEMAFIIRRYFEMRIDALVFFGVPLVISNLCTIGVRRISDDWVPEKRSKGDRPFCKAIDYVATKKAKQALLEQGFTLDDFYSVNNRNGKKYFQYYEDPFHVKYYMARAATEDGQALRAFTFKVSDIPSTSYAARVLYTSLRENTHLIVNFK